MEINERCWECGKIWSQEDKDKSQEEVKASMTVQPIVKE